MLQPKKWSTKLGGRELTIEVGKLALQASASCTVQYGDTVVLVTAAVSSNIREGIDYFPLSVEFQEKLNSAGKIKGSRFVKREGRPSDEVVLAGRIIDRSIRPLFDATVRNDIQVVITPLALDGENDPTIAGLIGASAALSISEIPWNGPIGAARVGRIDGNMILNPTIEQVEQSDMDVIVAGTPDKLVMVEAGASEVTEADMLEAMKWGCIETKPVIDLIYAMQQEVGKEKMSVGVANADTEGDNNVEEQVRQATKAFVESVADSMMFDSPKEGRKERVALVQNIKEAAKVHLTEQGFDEDAQGVGLKKIKDYVARVISDRILEKEERLDGRSLTDIRHLHAEIDVLPRVHGSALFMRGDTQVLSTVALGAPGDVQTLDTMQDDDTTKRYMHHYFDAPFTYGEAGFMRGPSRRAIGHGALAERALQPVLPPEEEFSYAIRAVSEILGSNGSSSMASTCVSSLSLMAAGVPIKKPVAGIAMGLASNEQGDWKVITDLQDVEDGDGGMDFKIAGTKDGITCVQMDTKTRGLVWDIVDQTVSQAYDARLEILDVMAKAIAEPRADLSPYAPRIKTIQIDPEKIGDIIGPGGKTIKKIVDDTGAQIDIEQDGRVMITTDDGDAMAAAVETITLLTKEVEAGEIYDGKVVRIEDFGAFVQLTPNKDGLVHVSEMAWERTNHPKDVVNMGDTVKVKVKEIDNLGRVNLTMKELQEKPEGWTPPKPRSDGPRGGGNNRGGGKGRGPRRDK